MSDVRALADALYAEEVARARAMRPEDRLLEGPRLFDRACRLMADGIRHNHPERAMPTSSFSWGPSRCSGAWHGWLRPRTRS